MKKLGILLLAATAATALFMGCDGETGTTSTGTPTGSSSSTSGGGESTTGGGGGSAPNLGDMPTYGVQVDRFGRPAINTALNHTFDADPAKAGTAKDAWNADAAQTEWVKNYKAEVAGNLAILDSLDTVCGNQALAGPMAMAGRYDTLAGVLADDRQWLNSDNLACNKYLAVETGVMNDCGGRALNYDVVDTSYTLLATGDPAKGVTDGIPVPNYATGKTFPYLAAPK
jgi:hypothetical protein